MKPLLVQAFAGPGMHMHATTQRQGYHSSESGLKLCPLSQDTKYVTLPELRQMMHPSSGLLWSPWFRCALLVACCLFVAHRRDGCCWAVHAVDALPGHCRHLPAGLAALSPLCAPLKQAGILPNICMFASCVLQDYCRKLLGGLVGGPG